MYTTNLYHSTILYLRALEVYRHIMNIIELHVMIVEGSMTTAYVF